jgi:hypothetical protein
MSLASDQLIAQIEREFPRFRIVPKRGDALSRLIDIALRVLTLGRQSAYLTRYHTVLFGTLYVPTSWQFSDDIARCITLRHERVHLRQRQRYGDVLLTFLYLVPFFPLGLAYGRARLEWEAYAETLRATAEYQGIAAVRASELRERIVSQFTSGAYGWMWPFPRAVQRWYDLELARIADSSGA